MAIILGVAAVLVYWPATQCGFVNFDDDLYVTANAHVQGGLTLENIKWAFLNPVASNWHPLTMLSHVLDFQWFGLTPGEPHVVNVLLHALDTVLVFVLFRQMTGALWRSAFVAALFAVHPLHVESVAWISERKDVLSCFFGLLSLIFYVRAARSHSSRDRKLGLALAFIFLTLGMMCKGMLVTWPCVMLLLDYWPLGRVMPGQWKSLLIEKIPFLALTVAMCVITLVVQRHAGAAATSEQLPFTLRSENALISYGRYLGMFFWPTNLAVFYPLPASWAMSWVLGVVVLLAVISWFVFVQRKSRPFLLVGWLWFLGTLIPVIGLVQVGDQALADRYMYLPSLGLFVIVVWGAYEFTRGWREQGTVLPITGATVLIICISLTEQQLAYWQNSETLFRHALAVTTGNYIADNNLAAVLEDRGDYDEAITRLQEAIKLKPYDVPAIYNLGNAFYATRQFDPAISEYQDALHYDPGYSGARLNLGNAYLGENQPAAALAQYQEVIRLDPGNFLAHNNLAETLARQGQNDAAITEYQQAIRFNPDYAEAYNNLGYLLQTIGRVNEAITQYQQALRVRPDYDLARNNLAAAQKMLDAPASR